MRSKATFILQELTLIYFATILRSCLVTSSDLYFITSCVKRWSCMIFLWLLHVKYYNIVASKDLWNGSVVTLSLSCLGFILVLFDPPLFVRKYVLIYSHIIYSVGQPSSVQQVGLICLLLFCWFFFYTPVLHHSLLYLHNLLKEQNSSGLIGQLNFNQSPQ